MPWMDAVDFEELLTDITCDNHTRIDARNFSITQLEAILDACAATHNWCIEFSSDDENDPTELTPRQQQIISNKVISLYHNGNHTDAIALEIFSQAVMIIDADTTFDFTANQRKYDVELHGLSRCNVLLDEAQIHVESFINNLVPDFMQAARTGDQVELERRLVYGVDVNSLHAGRTALDVACEHGHIDVVKQLLAINSCQPNMRTLSTLPPIATACKFKQLDILRILIGDRRTTYFRFGAEHVPGYQEFKDPIKQTILTDDQVFFIGVLELFVGRGKHPTNELLNGMYEYALRHEKHNVLLTISDLKLKKESQEREFISAVKNNNMEQLQNIMYAGVNVNAIFDGELALSIAVQLGNNRIVNHLLTDKNIKVNLKDAAGNTPFHYAVIADNIAALQMIINHYDFQYMRFATNHPEFNRICPVKIIIEHDKPAALEEFINWELRRQNTIRAHDNYLQEIHDYAESICSLQIVAKVQEIKVRQENLNREFFGYIRDNAEEPIIDMLTRNFNPNTCFEGRFALDLACELGYTGIVKTLLRSPVIAPNNVNDDGKTALEIALQCNQTRIVCELLASRKVNWCKFLDTNSQDYNPNKDPMRYAVEHDNPEMVKALLLRNAKRRKYSNPSRNFLEKIHGYATEENKRHVKLLISSYLVDLRKGKRIFTLDNSKDINEQLNYNQSISHSDVSIIRSIQRLARRYCINIVVDERGRRYLAPNNEDISMRHIFDSIADMIEEVQETDYRLYDRNSGESRPINIQRYRNYAYSMYNKIGSSPNDENNRDKYNSSYSFWHSDWLPEEGDALRDSVRAAGIKVWEAYALAVLAVNDRYAIPDKVLTEDDIAERRACLVRSLVDSERAYNSNNDLGRDYGGTSDSSCVHGTFCREFLALAGGKHADIRIVTHPNQWAAQVAQQALGKYYLSLPNQVDISRLLECNPDHLLPEQKFIVTNFYNSAKGIISDAICKEVGMLKDGGYLRDHELNAILDNIHTLTLPESEDELQEDLVQYADYQLMRVKPILPSTQIELLQYKLPNSPDVFLAAVMISALSENIHLEEIVSIKDLRMRIADIIDWATNPSRKDEKLDYLQVQLNRLVVSKYVPEENIEKYLMNVKYGAYPDDLMKWLVSAIYNAAIALYDHRGKHVFSVTPAILMGRLTTEHRILHVNKARQPIDSTQYNALVRTGAWEQIYPKIGALCIRLPAQLLEFDNQYYTDYFIMPNRSVDGYEQVKIPGDGNCCFNAVVVAMRAMNFALPGQIKNHFDLRIAVSQDLHNIYFNSLSMINSFQTTVNLSPFEQRSFADASSVVDDMFPNAIRQYNEEYNKQINSPTEYIRNISIIDRWGGAFELWAMSRVLDAKIIVHSQRYTVPLVVDAKNSAREIHVAFNGSHYNALVPTGTWVNLDPDDPILEFERNIDNIRNLYGCDEQNNNWSSLHWAVYQAEPDTVRALLQSGAYIFPDNDGVLPNQVPLKSEDANYLERRHLCTELLADQHIQYYAAMENEQTLAIQQFSEETKEDTSILPTSLRRNTLQRQLTGFAGDIETGTQTEQSDEDYSDAENINININLFGYTNMEQTEDNTSDEEHEDEHAEEQESSSEEDAYNDQQEIANDNLEIDIGQEMAEEIINAFTNFSNSHASIITSTNRSMSGQPLFSISYSNDQSDQEQDQEQNNNGQPNYRFG